MSITSDACAAPIVYGKKTRVVFHTAVVTHVVMETLCHREPVLHVDNDNTSIQLIYVNINKFVCSIHLKIGISRIYIIIYACKIFHYFILYNEKVLTLMVNIFSHQYQHSPLIFILTSLKTDRKRALCLTLQIQVKFGTGIKNEGLRED